MLSSRHCTQWRKFTLLSLLIVLPSVTQAPHELEGVEATLSKAPLGGVLTEPNAHETNRHQEEERYYSLEELERAKSTTAGYVLLLAVVFGLVLLYLVNFNDEDVRDATWQMISASLSIFIAVFLYTGMKLVFGTAIPHRWSPLVLCVPLFGVIWFSSQAVLLTMERPLQLRSFGTLSGHIGAFAAIEVAKDTMKLPSFRGKPLYTLFLLLGMIVILSVLVLVTNRIFKIFRRRIYGATLNEVWKDSSVESQHDTAAISLGFVFSQLMQAVLLGEAPIQSVLAFEPAERPIISREAYWILVGISGACLLLVFWFSYVKEKVANQIAGVVGTVATRTDDESSEEDSDQARRISRIMASFFAMSSSWCILALSQWTLLLSIKRNYGVDAVVSEVLSFIICSVIVCGLSIIAIFAIDKLADSKTFDEVALRNVIMAIGICVGLSWEATFDECMESIVSTDVKRTDTDFRLRRIFFAAALQIMLALLLIPAWTLHILPKAEPELAKHRKAYPSIYETFCCCTCRRSFRQVGTTRSGSESESDEANTDSEDGHRAILM